MRYSQKFIFFVFSMMLAVFGLAACSNADDQATGSEVVKNDEKQSQSAQNDAVKEGASKMQDQTSQLQAVLEKGDARKAQRLGEKMNDQWLTFENEVRDRFPLLYTKVEKYQQPIYAQSLIDQPDLKKMEGLSQNLQQVLGELKNAKESARKTSEVLSQAVKQYHDYLIEQTVQLVRSTNEFSQAVNKKNIKKAKELYAEARVYYERIEPVAESLGDLDPKIDARINDVDHKANWTGFHRLEKAIWKDRSLNGQKKIADQLLKDVKKLNEKVKTITLKPEQVVAGAMELLNEAAISKVTGEEERYSHLDLVDLSANVEGSEAVYHAIIPVLTKNNKDLANQLDKQFRSFQKTLTQYQKDGHFISYKNLNKDQIRKLSQELSQLSKSMAQTAKIFS